MDPDSLATMTPLAQFGVGVIRAMPALLEAFRTGGGVSWDAFGSDVREARAAQNRPAFLQRALRPWRAEPARRPHRPSAASISSTRVNFTRGRPEARPRATSSASSRCQSGHATN